MSTSLHASPIYGPVHSRRLGLSVGINLMPADGKCCTFDCIYCECGYNRDRIPRSRRPSREEVRRALHEQLRRMIEAGDVPDVLTFAGNGEPTGHPEFADIVADAVALRDELCPNAKISVLSNATLTHRPDVCRALMRVDNNIQKLDTVSNDYILRVDRPVAASYRVEDIIAQLKAFDGHVIVQTMFMHGTMAGVDVSNTADEYVLPWLQALQEIRPSGVMIYTIDRDTPDKDLQKATRDELDAIRSRVLALGIPCTASY